MKTIKQIADELGVSKGVVENCVKRENVIATQIGDDHTQTKYFNDEQVKQIKTRVLNNARSTRGKSTVGEVVALKAKFEEKQAEIQSINLKLDKLTFKLKTVEAQLTSANEQISFLQSQLTSKDDQIIATQQQLAAAQFLHNDDKHKLLALEDQQKQMSEIRLTWWQRRKLKKMQAEAKYSQQEEPQE